MHVSAAADASARRSHPIATKPRSPRIRSGARREQPARHNWWRLSTSPLIAGPLVQGNLLFLESCLDKKDHLDRAGSRRRGFMPRRAHSGPGEWRSPDCVAAVSFNGPKSCLLSPRWRTALFRWPGLDCGPGAVAGGHASHQAMSDILKLLSHCPNRTLGGASPRKTIIFRASANCRLR